MKILNGIYKIWVWFWFLVVFLMLYPFFLLFTIKETWYPAGHFLNKLWAYIVFTLCFLPVKVEFRFRPKKKTPYIYCPNHASYLDIATLCYALPGYYKFVGKASLAKVPLFGYMFRKLYIAVDRKSQISRYKTMIQSFEAIDKKIGLAIFPEGTIPQQGSPKMISFKDGPFRIAIEKQIPVVPVTIPYNWIILPDDGKFTPHRHLLKTIIHEPIETKGMTNADVDSLKEKTFRIIEKELEEQVGRLKVNSK